MIHWSHGYAAIAGTHSNVLALVTSPDGAKWTLIDAVPTPQDVAAGPEGLVVVSGDSTQTIWTSTDGTTWHDAGSPSGVSTITSIAGTTAGLVATTSEVVRPVASAASEPGADDIYGVASSSDGVHWAPVSLEPGATWDHWVGVQVHSNGSRFFFTGSLVTGSGSDQTSSPGIWWSDDGRTWQRASWTPSTAGYPVTLEFAGDGMLAWIGSFGNGQGDAVEMALSHDGGKTWQDDPSFGPFGPCGGDQCQASGSMGSNGSIFLAVSGSTAWTSTDGSSWTQIAWAPTGCPDVGAGFEVLPRGVLIGNHGLSDAPACYGSAE